MRSFSDLVSGIGSLIRRYPGAFIGTAVGVYRELIQGSGHPYPTISVLLHGFIGQQIYNLPAHTARHFAAIRRAFSMMFTGRGPNLRVQLHVGQGQQISQETLQRLATVGAQLAMQDPNILIQVLEGRDPVLHLQVQRVDQVVQQQQHGQAPVPHGNVYQAQDNQLRRRNLGGKNQ